MIMQPFSAMALPAPGHCTNCGADAYIQLAGQLSMVCAHCYTERTDTETRTTTPPQRPPRPGS